MPEIGATLREARMRARIDVSEIEAQTKIRAKYLRALENEEWDLLPGPTYARSFLRTYAQALGLDTKLLMEEYRLRHERPSEADLQPIVAPSQRRPGVRVGRPRPGRGFLIGVVAILVVIVLLVIGLLSDGGGSDHTATTNAGTPPKATTTSRSHHAAAHPRGTTGPSSVVSLRLHATGQVYVCLLANGGRKLIPGLILAPGTTSAVYRSRRFTVTLGNNALTMTVDGTARAVPASSGPIGYSITRAGRRLLSASARPTCG